MKICFVGLGSIGKRHCKNISRILTERNISYRIDAFRNGTDSLPEDITCLLHKEYTVFEQLPKDYDIIFITNPTSMHYEMIQKMVTNAKHMFIEKPIFEACQYQIGDIDLNSESIYYVACPLRFSPVIRFLKNRIMQEKVYSVRAISSSYLPDWRKGIDYRTNYSAKKAQGGGVSLDLIHEWDYITYLFGMPETVYNLRGHFSHLETDSDDISVYIAEYQDKLVELHLDYIGRYPMRILELYCEKEVIHADLLNNKIEFRGNRMETLQLENEDIYVNEMNYFLDILLHKKENFNDMRHAYQVLNLAVRKAGSI